MIRYALRCEKGHDFDGWFRSSDAFESTRAAGHVACTQCGSPKVEKTLMAPALPAASKAEPAADSGRAVVQAIDELRRRIEAESHYVGPRFADEARAMHEGRVPSRAIHGEARIEEARKLIEDGVPVAPLPFVPRRKMN